MKIRKETNENLLHAVPFILGQQQQCFMLYLCLHRKMRMENDTENVEKQLVAANF